MVSICVDDESLNMTLRIKRIYEPPAAQDGTRILVDRLWPRGVSREEAHVHAWLKEIAPSAELRRWFGHDPDKWDAFRRRYLEELENNPAAVEELKRQIGQSTATLLYGARDTEHNNALVLRDFIDSQ